MDYGKIKKSIDRAIKTDPLSVSALEDMFALCREYEKEDFDTAHKWNHEFRHHPSESG